MEFDKSKVYTTVNADELKPGSKVIVADRLSTLKAYVENYDNIVTLYEIKDEEHAYRFACSDDSSWSLAYLVTPPEEKKLKWTDLQIGDVVKCKFSNVRSMVTGIHEDEKCVFFGGEWTRDKELEDWEKVEDTNE